MNTQTLVLRHGKIERNVFFAALDALPRHEFLSPEEATMSAGFKFAAKKQGFLLGRLAAKRALGALLEEPDLRRIEIRAGVFGQPLTLHPRAAAAEVTVSHSHGLAVALAYPADYPMGIDLETISAVSAESVIGELQASPAELTWLATGGVDAATACCILWTARESLGKALKLGLNSPLGILALSQVLPGRDGTWSGQYLNFPRCQFRARVESDRVLSLALPRAAELDEMPQLQH